MEVRQEIDVQNLWSRYEEIAMHFNDLLMRLRTQSLAGIAALSALVGIFSKDGIADAHLDWVVAQAIFAAMIGFWIAIWILDMAYYNRLLTGAVKAIVDLENATKPNETFGGHINMSTKIDAQFTRPVIDLKDGRYGGVILFYVIVLIVLVGGLVFTHLRV